MPDICVWQIFTQEPGPRAHILPQSHLYLSPEVTLLPDLEKMVFSLAQNNNICHAHRDPFFSQQHVCVVGCGINQVP